MNASRLTRYSIAVSALFAVAVVALAALKAHAAAETVKVPLAGEALSPCVPPGAYLSGHLQMTTRFSADTRGTHLIIMVNSAGAKILVPMPDGAVVEFVSNENHEHEANASTLGATEFTIHDSFRYSSPGKRENYKCDVKMHMTINSNGTVTANVENVYVDCVVPCCDGNVVEPL